MKRQFFYVEAAQVANRQQRPAKDIIGPILSAAKETVKRLNSQCAAKAGTWAEEVGERRTGEGLAELRRILHKERLLRIEITCSVQHASLTVDQNVAMNVMVDATRALGKWFDKKRRPFIPPTKLMCQFKEAVSALECVAPVTASEPAKTEKTKHPIPTEPLTKTQLGELFSCHRSDVDKLVLKRYPHEIVGTKAKPKFRMNVANMPPAYHEKHRTK